MVHYKLTYFDFFGRGEAIRQIFIAASQEFEDERITNEEWKTRKSKTPYGHLPVLEVDGRPIAQSGAIGRYLARQFGLNGKDAYEESVAESLVAQYNDLINEAMSYMLVYFGYAEGDKEKLKQEIYVPAVKKHMPLFVNFLKNNKSGYLVGDNLTWADIFIANGVSIIHKHDPKLIGEFPEVEAHFQRIHNLPRIKEYLEKRPDKSKWTIHETD